LPEVTIRRVCAFLKLPFAPAMLEPHTQKHSEQDAVIQRDNGTWLDPSLGFRPIDSSQVNIWQAEPKTFQVAAINAAFHDHALLRGLGGCRRE
jgi:hypothetical protein